MVVEQFKNATISSTSLKEGVTYDIMQAEPIKSIEVTPKRPLDTLVGVLTFTKGNATIAMNLANGEYYQQVGGIGQMLLTVTGLDVAKPFNIIMRCK